MLVDSRLHDLSFPACKVVADPNSLQTEKAGWKMGVMISCRRKHVTRTEMPHLVPLSVSLIQNLSRAAGPMKLFFCRLSELELHFGRVATRTTSVSSAS
jgi:hypothetical protein